MCVCECVNERECVSPQTGGFYLLLREAEVALLVLEGGQFRVRHVVDVQVPPPALRFWSWGSSPVKGLGSTSWKFGGGTGVPRP